MSVTARSSKDRHLAAVAELDEARQTAADTFRLAVAYATGTPVSAAVSAHGRTTGREQRRTDMSCKYPQHHLDDRAPGAVQFVGLLVVVGTVAVIVTHCHALLACMVVAGVVLVLVAALMALARNHGSGYDPELEHQAALDRAQAPRAAPVSVTSASSPAVTAPASTPALEAAPVVHQHLHFHGVSDEDLAEVVRKAIRPPEDAETW